MTHGLSERSFNYILEAIKSFPEIEEARIYGSRATGHHKPGSDIDIAIKGAGITFRTVSRLHGILEEELPIPYFFDITNYNTLKNDKLRHHIDAEGLVIFNKKTDQKIKNRNKQ